MKTNYIKVAYCTILLFIVNITTFSQDNWSWLNPKPMGSSVESCGYFPGTNTVVAVGANGLIMRSTDNGTNWSHINSNLSTGFYSVSTINSTTAFIAGEGPTILKTQDAGATWTTVPTDTISRTISKIHFLDETSGYLLIENIVCFTSNGGINWTKLNFDALNGTLISMHAVSNSEVYVGKSSGEVIRCLGPYPGSSAIYTACSTSVVSIKQFAGKLIAVGYDQQIKYSTDNGSNWLVCLGTFTDLSFKDAAVITNDLMIAFTATAQIVKSTDGNNWNTITTLPSNDLTSASGNLSGKGILLGGKGIQYSSEDGGSTWTKTSTTSSSGILRSITCNGSNILASEDNGLIIRSTDAGVTWSTMAVSGGTTIQDIKFANPNTAFLVAGAKFYKSIDAGATWSLKKTFPLASLYELACFSESDIVVAGSVQTTYRSTDGGETWSDTNRVPVAGTLYSIFALSGSSTAYCAGTSGKVFKSNDKGETWSTSGNATGTINSIWFSTPAIGWAVGNAGKIYMSVNYGGSWSTITSLTSNDLQSVRFSDANNGIIVGYGGVILKTTDGGTTWIKSAQITGNHLLSVTLIDGSTTLAAGYAGTVIKSTNAPLPVELTSFTASVRNNEVHLNWETATEIDNYGFDIERKDNNSNWTKIGFVEGHFTSNSPKYYTFSDKPTGSSIYSYRLKQIDNDGKFEYSNEVEVLIDNLPNGYLLEQNYPNPFNPETSIKFVLKENTKATLKVYNLMGELVATLFDGIADAGRYYDIKFTGTNLASGFYIYTLDAGKYRQTRKMMLMK